VLDLGTGSGAILLTLLAERPEAEGLGTDVSEAALRVARGNAVRLGVRRCSFRQSDWFSAVDGQFDLIVANPPYIAEWEMADLAPEVRDWEPELALTPGGDGLSAYRIIAAGARRCLRPGGRVAVEIGPAQAEAVMALFRAGGLAEIECRTDFDGRDRVILGRNR
jgi:release factor glutamine methyltransferase